MERVMIFKPHRWFRGKKKNGNRARATPLRLETLEQRVTPTTNLRVESAHFSTPALGALTNVVADFSTEGLPVWATYVVKVTMNNDAHYSGVLNWGAGTPGVNHFSITLGNWVVNDGNEVIRVGLFPQVELPAPGVIDTSKQFTLDTAPFQYGTNGGQKMVTPIAGTP